MKFVVEKSFFIRYNTFRNYGTLFSQFNFYNMEEKNP